MDRLADTQSFAAIWSGHASHNAALAPCARSAATKSHWGMNFVIARGDNASSGGPPGVTAVAIAQANRYELGLKQTAMRALLKSFFLSPFGLWPLGVWSLAVVFGRLPFLFETKVPVSR